MLFPVLPQAAGDAPRRALLVAEKLWRVLNSPEGDEEWEERVGQLQADLERFVTGAKLDSKYLFLLYPSADAVWEIRSVQHDPSLRVLGLFPAKDVYVSCEVALREELGGWQSRGWKAVKRNARAVWRWLFPAHDPIVTTDVGKVVTGADSGRYYKERG